MSNVKVGNKREDGNYDLLIDGQVHPTHYIGLTLLGADDDENVTLNYCMDDTLVKRYIVRSSNGNSSTYTGDAKDAVEFYANYGTPEPNAAELLRQGKAVNIDNGVVIVTIEEANNA